MSKVISLRLKDNQAESLARAARYMGRSPSETATILLSEALLQRDFPFIEFRDSRVGRQAYLKGTRLAIWQIADIARDYDGDIARTAEHLNRPQIQIAAALRYAAAFPEEIDAAISDNEWAAANIEQLVPNVEVVKVDAASA